jgi:hypothetical protein
LYGYSTPSRQIIIWDSGTGDIKNKYHLDRAFMTISENTEGDLVVYDGMYNEMGTLSDLIERPKLR